MGGWTDGGDIETTLLKPDGTSEAGWDMQQETLVACSVEDTATGTLLVIGGSDTSNELSDVHRYDEDGYVEALPSLNYARVGHGCAGYYNDDGDLVRNYHRKAFI